MKKEIKNYVFVKNGEILSEFGTFSSRFTTSPSRPLMILFPLTILAFNERIAISGSASHGAHGAHGHLFGCGRLGPIRLHLVIFSDVATTASAIQYLLYAVSTCPHEAWQRTLRKSSILDRLHPIGFSRGGV